MARDSSLKNIDIINTDAFIALFIVAVATTLERRWVFRTNHTSSIKSFAVTCKRPVLDF